MGGFWLQGKHIDVGGNPGVLAAFIALGIFRNISKSNSINRLLKQIVAVSIDKDIVGNQQLIDPGSPGEQPVFVVAGRQSIQNECAVGDGNLAVMESIRAVFLFFHANRNEILIVRIGTALQYRILDMQATAARNINDSAVFAVEPKNMTAGDSRSKCSGFNEVP